MDHFILDTHTQHTSLMFIEYLFHLSYCTCLNVICVCLGLSWLNQKDFWSFYFFLRVIFIIHFFLSFVLTLFFNVSSLFLCWKTGVKVFHESFATWLRVTKLKNAYLAIFGHQAVCFSSSSQVTYKLATRKMAILAISWVFHVLLVQNSLYDSFMTPSFSKPSFSMLLHQNSTNFNCFNSINISKVIFNTFHCF